MTILNVACESEVKSCRSILALHKMKLLVLGPGRGSTETAKRYGLYVCLG